MVPMRLKPKWMHAARRAFLLVPMLDNIAVTQVPIFCPIIMGMAEPKVMAPVALKAWRIPTEAEED